MFDRKRRSQATKVDPVETVEIKDFRDFPDLLGRKAIKCLACGAQATHQRVVLRGGEPYFGTNRCEAHKDDEFA